MLRSLGIPARLVCSLQAVSFKLARKNEASASRKKDNVLDYKGSTSSRISEETQRALGLGKYKLRKNGSSNKLKREQGDDDDDYNPLSKQSRVDRLRKPISVLKNSPKRDNSNGKYWY